LLKADRAEEAAPIVARQIEVNRRWQDASPDNPEARFALSLAYRRQGELREATNDFAGAIASHREALAIQATLVDASPDFALSHALSRMHLGRNQVAAGEVSAGRESLVAAARALAALVQTYPDAVRFRDYLAEAWAQVAEAQWRAPADGAAARRAAESAIAIWAAFEAEGKLAPPSAARRDALVKRLSRQ
jgi:tetratricopeptide (TPR) repeat protein